MHIPTEVVGHSTHFKAPEKSFHVYDEFVIIVFARVK